MTESLTIDSSVWLAYFLDGLYQEIIDSDKLLFSSALTLFEVKRQFKVITQGNKAVEFIENHSMVISVDGNIAKEATNIKAKMRLGMADAIIATTAQITNSKLVTRDKDFEGLDFAQVLT